MKKIFLMLLALFVMGQAQAAITVYTDRPLEPLRGAVQKFKAETGVEVNLDGMSYSEIIARLDDEGENTPADLLFTKDLVYLGELAKDGRLAGRVITMAALVETYALLGFLISFFMLNALKAGILS